MSRVIVTLKATAFVALLAFILLPLGMVGWISVSENSTDWPPSGFSLRWLREALAYQPFLDGLQTSIVIGLAASAIAVALGTLAAYGLTRYPSRTEVVTRSMSLLPLLLPRVVLGFAIFIVVVRAAAHLYGSLWVVIIAHTLLLIPFSTLIMTGALAGVDPRVEQAAQDLGYRRVAAFVKVVLPAVAAALVASAAFGFTTSFDEVDVSIFLLSPTDTTLPVQMFLYAQQRQDPLVAAASAVLVLLTAVLIAVTFGAIRWVGRRGRVPLPGVALADPASSFVPERPSEEAP